MSHAAARRKTGSAPDTRTGRCLPLRATPAAPLILLVDDSEETRALYSEFLINSKMRVAHAVDGHHAVLKVQSLVPDLVVMDLAMPIVDGFEATRAIKAHPKTAHIPIVVLTGQVTAESLRRAENSGASAVLTKPCLPSELFDLVVTILDR